MHALQHNHHHPATSPTGGFGCRPTVFRFDSARVSCNRPFIRAASLQDFTRIAKRHSHTDRSSPRLQEKRGERLQQKHNNIGTCLSSGGGCPIPTKLLKPFFGGDLNPPNSGDHGPNGLAEKRGAGFKTRWNFRLLRFAPWCDFAVAFFKNLMQTGDIFGCIASA